MEYQHVNLHGYWKDIERRFATQAKQGALRQYDDITELIFNDWARSHFATVERISFKGKSRAPKAPDFSVQATTSSQAVYVEVKGIYNSREEQKRMARERRERGSCTYSMELGKQIREILGRARKQFTAEVVLAGAPCVVGPNGPSRITEGHRS